MERPKIAVLTLQYGALPYFEFSTQLNRAYCQRHGYDWIVAEPDPDRDGRHLNWHKVRKVADALRHHDYVLFLDADAWFHDQDRTIEQQLIQPHMQGRTLILIGTDRQNRDHGWHDDQGNTGSFLVRSTPLAQHIMAEWWAIPEYDPKTAHKWPLDQLAFNRHILNRWRSRINLISYHYLNGMDGEFIRHMMNNPMEERVRVLAEAWDRFRAAESGSVPLNRFT